MTQRTLVLIKPDAVRRGLIGSVLSRYETKGLEIVAMEQRRADAASVDRHYVEHLERDWYPELREYLTSGPIVAVVLAGPSAIEVVRLMHGVTNGVAAAPGTIRGDFALSGRYNLVHASDSQESFERELAIWFPGLV